MMAFGWRPVQSCYKTDSEVGTKGSCSGASWYWLLLAGAVLLGANHRKRGAA